MGVTFTPAGAEKIKKAVNLVLNQPQNRAGAKTPTHHIDPMFLALVMSYNGPDLSGKQYAFVRVAPAFDSGGDFSTPNGLNYEILDLQDEIGNAFEANGNVQVPLYTVVMMRFGGYDNSGNPVFVFQYESLPYNIPLPPHDHTDAINGSFAFCVFYPGTGLAQQNWAM